MTVISVDLAYKRYRDIGIVGLTADADGIACEFIRPILHGEPNVGVLAEYLSELCTEWRSNLLILDGPQGWKDPSNGLTHSRVCEGALNTPAKTGLPGSVLPANYGPFVDFSVRVFDCLAELGWHRFSGSREQFDGSGRIQVESFPLSAWRTLALTSLPGKRRARQSDIDDRLHDLSEIFPLRVEGNPSHDELQALVAGLAGISLQQGDWSRCRVEGRPPFEFNGYWREGLIVNPRRP